jgi:hypothetical protein
VTGTETERTARRVPPERVSKNLSDATRHDPRREGEARKARRKIPHPPPSCRLSEGHDEGPVLLAQLLQRLARGGMPQGPRAALEALGPRMRVLGLHGPCPQHRPAPCTSLGFHPFARTPQACFTYAKTCRLPPRLTQANTSKSNVLLSSSAKVLSRRPLLSCLGDTRPRALGGGPARCSPATSPLEGPLAREEDYIRHSWRQARLSSRQLIRASLASSLHSERQADFWSRPCSLHSSWE